MSRPSINVVAAERYLAGARGGEPSSSGAGPHSSARIPAWRSLPSITAFIKSWIERRRPQPKLLSVCERLDIGPKKSLTLVAYQDRRFLIGCGPDTVAAIHEISPAATERIAADRIPVLRPARWSQE